MANNNIHIRVIERDDPDLRRLARALIDLAIEQQNGFAAAGGTPATGSNLSTVTPINKTTPTATATPADEATVTATVTPIASSDTPHITKTDTDAADDNGTGGLPRVA